MNKQACSADFIQNLCDEALHSTAVNHPYLTAMKLGDFPDMDVALRDFAFQYSLYSKNFTRFVVAVIDNLADTRHRNILQMNLDEEQGHVHDIDLPPDILQSIVGQPHSNLFRRFQEALGINSEYRKTAYQCQSAKLWGKQFLQLCEVNELVGVGAIGLGTELIVSKIYSQILQGLQNHSTIEPRDYVFFDLHSQCDDEHAAQFISIAEELAVNEMAREQIEYGTKMAINMRVMFWDKMLERALQVTTSNNLNIEKKSAIGY